MKIFIIAIIAILAGCSSGEKEKSSELNIALGEDVFNKNCISCHGSKGVGLAKSWKVNDENGNFPAHRSTARRILGIIHLLICFIQLIRAGERWEE